MTRGLAPAPPGPVDPSEEARTRRALLHMLEDLQRERDVVRRARRRWLATVDAIGAPLVVVDARMRVARANRAYARLAGMEFPELIGRPWWECFPRIGIRDQPPPARFTLPTGEAFRTLSSAIDSAEGTGLDSLHVLEDVTVAHRAEAATRALERIASSPRVLAGDLEAVAREVTEEAARVAGVARANVWLFNEAEDELRCIDLYEAGSGTHSSGAVLHEREFGNEFTALKGTPYVDASDALTDPRTSGYVESYLKPLGITSMLDTVVQVSGKHIGLLCLEHVGAPRRWRPDEIAFAARLADKLAVTMSNHRARQAEERHRMLFMSSKDAFLTLSPPAWGFDSCNPSAVEMFRARDDAQLLTQSPASLSPDRQEDASESREKARAMIGIALREGNHYFDWTHRRMDGECFPATVLLTRIRVAGVDLLTACVRDVSERRRADEQLRDSLVATVRAIAATVEMRDPYTAGHQHRVADLARAIALEMGWPAGRAEGVHFGALIHDLGKVRIPVELLSKPTALSRIEFELIKTHPDVGYDIVKGIAFPWPVAAMVHQHHERFDGSGYPQGLKGEQIAPEARVLSVADVVEAMSSHRPYRAGLGIEPALAEIDRQRGVLYDPDAVDACLRLFREKGFTLP